VPPKKLKISHRLKYAKKICKECFRGERKALAIGYMLDDGAAWSIYIQRHVLGGAHGQPKMHTIEGYAFGYTRGSRFIHAHDPTFNGHGGPQVSIPPPKITSMYKCLSQGML
jgi:hypothetical protein